MLMNAEQIMWNTNIKKPTALIPSTWFSVLNIDCRKAMMKVTGSTVIDVTLPLSFLKKLLLFSCLVFYGKFYEGDCYIVLKVCTAIS